jgi:hypothetical protein
MFDQQAIEVMGNVQLYFQAYNVTKEQEYLRKMFQSFSGSWVKTICGPLYDYETVDAATASSRMA